MLEAKHSGYKKQTHHLFLEKKTLLFTGTYNNTVA